MRPLIYSIIFSFLLVSIGPYPLQAQELSLPMPGQMLELSKPYMPVSVKGLMVHPEDPFKFDFLIDSGDTGLKGDQIKAESMKLIKYFLAALTVPEDEMWVNLSPYEKDRIILKSFGDTGMGRDLLAQDYILKQLTASLTYPEKAMGKAFWDKVYAQAKVKFGTTNIPVNTFNKVWIVPRKASIYEHNNGAFVVEAKLKVMLEQDYLSMSKHADVGQDPNINSLGSQIVREIIIPALEKEVNEGANFSNLRQIYQAMILATWYKIRLKNSILAKLYVDKNKVGGVGQDKLDDVESIYQRYLKAFKKGVYNYIKEERGPTGEIVPRKYVSGGFDPSQLAMVVSQGLGKGDPAMLRGEGDMSKVSWQATQTMALKPDAVTAATEENYKEFLPYPKKIMSFEQFAYDLGIHDLVKARARGHVFYPASGVDITHVLLTTNGREFDMIDILVPSYETFFSYKEKYWDVDTRKMDEYIQFKRTNGFAHISYVDSDFSGSLIVELKALGIDKDQLQIERIKDGFRIVFTKRFPGDLQPQTRIFNFIRSEATGFRPDKPYDILYQRAEFRDEPPYLIFDHLLKNIDPYMVENGFMVVNPYGYRINEETRRGEEVREDVFGILKAMGHYDVVPPTAHMMDLENGLEEMYSASEKTMGYGFKMEVFRKSSDAAMTVIGTGPAASEDELSEIFNITKGDREKFLFLQPPRKLKALEAIFLDRIKRIEGVVKDPPVSLSDDRIVMLKRDMRSMSRLIALIRREIGRRTILVITVDAKLRERLSGLLQDPNYLVVWARSPNEVRALFRTSVPRYAIIDYSLKDAKKGIEDGLDILRLKDWSDETRVIFTASAPFNATNWILVDALKIYRSKGSRSILDQDKFRFIAGNAGDDDWSTGIKTLAADIVMTTAPLTSLDFLRKTIESLDRDLVDHLTELERQHWQFKTLTEELGRTSYPPLRDRLMAQIEGIEGTSHLRGEISSIKTSKAYFEGQWRRAKASMVKQTMPSDAAMAATSARLTSLDFLRKTIESLDKDLADQRKELARQQGQLPKGRIEALRQELEVTFFPPARGALMAEIEGLEEGIGKLRGEIADIEKEKADFERQLAWQTHSSWLQSKMRAARMEEEMPTYEYFDRAMSVSGEVERPHYLGTAYQVSGPSKKKGRTKLDILEIFGPSLTEQEQEHVIAQIKNDPRKEAVLLTAEALALGIKEGKIVLKQSDGIIPQAYLDKEVEISDKTSALLESSWTGFPTSLPDTEKVRIKAGGYFRIKVHDKESGRDLYLLTFNHPDFLIGRYRLGPVGGGYKLTADGQSLYEARGIFMEDIKADPLEGDNPSGKNKLEFWRVISRKSLNVFMALFNAGIGREFNPLREFQKEVVGPDSESRLFDQLPQSLVDMAMKAEVPGGIDLNARGLDLQIKRDDKDMPLSIQFQNLGRIRIDALYPRILNITPVNNLPELLGGPRKI